MKIQVYTLCVCLFKAGICRHTYDSDIVFIYEINWIIIRGNAFYTPTDLVLSFNSSLYILPSKSICIMLDETIH